MNTLRTDPPFDPASTADATLDHIDQILSDVPALLDRLRWTRERLGREITELRGRRETAELLTEQEAADRLKMPGDTPEQRLNALRRLRRQHKFAHVIMSGHIYYTADHLRRIVDHFSTDGTRSYIGKRLKAAA